MNPPAAYPTPPPPGIRSTSSSLAFALGHPLTYPNQSKPSIEHAPKRKEPVVAFNDFVAQKDQEKPAERSIKGEQPLRSTQQLSQVASESLQSNSHLGVQQAIPTPQIHVVPSTCSSTPVTPRSNANPPCLLVSSLPTDNSLTPRKRKYADEVKGSPLKRVHTVPSEPQEESRAQSRSLQATPSSSRATPRHVMAYVELPPLPSAWRTPSKKHSSTSTRPENFDASGSEEEDDLRYKLGTYTSVKSSARRTGDRDERGGKPAIDVLLFIYFLFSTS
jgi:cohesin loading factor subunit SCC2